MYRILNNTFSMRNDTVNFNDKEQLYYDNLNEENKDYYLLKKSIEIQEEALKKYFFTENLYNESSEKINEINKSIEILMTTIQNPDEYNFNIINHYIENIKVNGIKKVYAGDLNLRCDRFKQKIINLLNSDNLKLVCDHLDYIIIKILH